MHKATWKCQTLDSTDHLILWEMLVPNFKYHVSSLIGLASRDELKLSAQVCRKTSEVFILKTIMSKEGEREKLHPNILRGGEKPSHTTPQPHIPCQLQWSLSTLDCTSSSWYTVPPQMQDQRGMRHSYLCNQMRMRLTSILGTFELENSQKQVCPVQMRVPCKFGVVMLHYVWAMQYVSNPNQKETLGSKKDIMYNKMTWYAWNVGVLQIFSTCKFFPLRFNSVIPLRRIHIIASRKMAKENYKTPAVMQTLSIHMHGCSEQVSKHAKGKQQHLKGMHQDHRGSSNRRAFPWKRWNWVFFKVAGFSISFIVTWDRGARTCLTQELVSEVFNHCPQRKLSQMFCFPAKWVM